MRAPHPEPDLLVLRRLAEELAQSRKERTTSGHLLAAIVSQPSQAAELLLERKLGADILLKAARATTDEEPDPLVRAVQRARELAARTGTGGPTAPRRPPLPGLPSREPRFPLPCPGSVCETPHPRPDSRSTRNSFRRCRRWART